MIASVVVKTFDTYNFESNTMIVLQFCSVSERKVVQDFICHLLLLIYSVSD